MVSSGINIRTCFADELYNLYSVREKISLSPIFDKNRAFREWEIASGKRSTVMAEAPV